LAALRPETTVYTATAHNDVSFGALRLIDSSLRPQGALKVVAPFDGDLESYRTRWRTELERVA
ncbi:MAG: carbohydrate kinase, partial [Proteobacteria bacterium]